MKKLVRQLRELNRELAIVLVEAFLICHAIKSLWITLFR